MIEGEGKDFFSGAIASRRESRERDAFARFAEVKSSQVKSSRKGKLTGIIKTQRLSVHKYFS